ncbi:MAG TPA: outer membrane lipoprotein-sorting protein [Planctomycetota bacterium]|nr:outer membrane lipoprotein-sorting protein [Planctomycetota bacterium]
MFRLHVPTPVRNCVLALLFTGNLVAADIAPAPAPSPAAAPADPPVTPQPPPTPAPAPPAPLPAPMPTITFDAKGQGIVPDVLLPIINKRFVRADHTLDLEAVVKYFEDLYRSDSSIAEAQLTVIKPNLERTLAMKSWSRGQDKALIIITDPPREKDTATLKVDKNLWNYLPRIKKTIRIPPSMMLSAWMGSDFTNDDLVRESSFSKDYVYTLIGPSQNPPGWVVRFTAKEGVVGLWQKFDLVLSPDGTIPLESKWYDRKGELARTLTWDQVKEMDGKRIPCRLTLVPQDQPGQKTIMVYSMIKFGAEVDEGKFSLTQLEQQR